MKQEIEEKLARSLTAETTGLIPFLPYLLQDLWELGSNPGEITRLLKEHLSALQHTKILDLACGKGAVSIKIANELGVSVYGFDLITEFIDYAGQKAKEYAVESLCHFAVGDINEVVNNESGYDCVIFGAVGNVLGNPQETLEKLMKTIKYNGFIIIDDAYVPDELANNEVKYKNYEYLTREQWINLFKKLGLGLVEEAIADDDYDFDSDNRAIAMRADELTVSYPEKQELFDGYVQSQLNESDDLTDNIVGVTWMLQKIQ